MPKRIHRFFRDFTFPSEVVTRLILALVMARVCATQLRQPGSEALVMWPATSGSGLRFWHPLDAETTAPVGSFGPAAKEPAGTRTSCREADVLAGGRHRYGQSLAAADVAGKGETVVLSGNFVNFEARAQVDSFVDGQLHPAAVALFGDLLDIANPRKSISKASGTPGEILEQAEPYGRANTGQKNDCDDDQHDVSYAHDGSSLAARKAQRCRALRLRQGM